MILSFLLGIMASELLEGLSAETAPQSCSVTAHTLLEGDSTDEILYRFDVDTGQWQLKQRNGASPTEEEIAEAAANQNEPWSNNYPTTVELVQQLELTSLESEDGRVLLQAGQLPADTIEVQGRDLSRHMRLEVELADTAQGPFIERSRIYAAKPFRVAMLAKVHASEFITEYRHLPDGRPVMAMTEVMSEVSALGKTQKIRAITTYKDYDCAG